MDKLIVGDRVKVGRCWSYGETSEPMFIEEHIITHIYDDGVIQFDGFSTTESAILEKVNGFIDA